MSAWAESGLPRFLIDAALTGITISFVGWLVSLALARAKTEWRISAILAVLVSLIAVPLTVSIGQNLGTGRVPTPVTHSVAQPEGFAQKELYQQRFVGSSTPVAPPTVAQETNTFPSPQLVGGAWAVFSGALLLLAAIRLLLLRLWLKKNGTLENPLKGSIAHYRAQVSAPFCGGIFKPFVVVPTDFEDLSDAERRAVTTHELAHLELHHPAHKLLGEVAIALFGWVPFVPLLTRLLADLQERQSDEAVVRQYGDGLGLAKGLVRFAERSGARMQPASTLSIVRRKSRLESRVQRLVQTGGLSMPPKKPIVTLAALSFGFVVTAIGLAAQSGKDPLSEARAFMPYQPGTTMTYNVTDSDGRKSQIRLTATTLQEHKPYPVMEFIRVQDKYESYDYWMATRDGLMPLDNRAMMGPGFTVNRSRKPQLPMPAKVGYEWNWQEPFRGQTASGLNDNTPPATPPPIPYSGKIVAVDESVKVPYGTVKATVVDIKSHGNYGYTMRTYWAKNVGPVKREYTDNKGNITRTEELVSVTRGKG